MSFSADLRKFCHVEAPEKTNRIVRAVVIEIANRVVYRSPVGDAKYWQSPAPAGYAGGRFRGTIALPRTPQTRCCERPDTTLQVER